MASFVTWCNYKQETQSMARKYTMKKPVTKKDKKKKKKRSRG